MIKKNSKIGIVSCSDGVQPEKKDEIDQLKAVLEQMELVPVFSDCIYRKVSVFSAPARERAEALMRFYRDKEIDAIFDVSGGHIGNGVLPYLDYDVIASSGKEFWGYSDLTTVINSIYAKSGMTSVLWQTRNLVRGDGSLQQKRFIQTVFEEGSDLFDFDYHFIQGESLDGTLIGGNLHCLLKLAGTEFWPDMQDKVLFLEGLSGTIPEMSMYLTQMDQLDVFKKVRGVILGTFTQMEAEGCRPDIVTLLKDFVDPSFPIVQTREIGHATDSKALRIGAEISLSRK